MSSVLLYVHMEDISAQILCVEHLCIWYIIVRDRVIIELWYLTTILHHAYKVWQLLVIQDASVDLE